MPPSASNTPWLGVSLMPQDDFREAVQPLFDAEAIDVVEWSFDTGWGPKPLPVWLTGVLQTYHQRDRLLGHGVSYSLLSANWDSEQWLACLAAECQEYRYRQISEHLGWMAAGEFVQSAPLPMPMLPEVVRVGGDRLKHLADVAQVPVGLENLAFAFSRRDVLEQGQFLEVLLEPVHGFIVLDVHNLYCQMHNFQLSAAEILQTYPLERVKEIHVSGGSWSDVEGKTVRRDTHDQAIPEPVFDVLTLAMKHCCNVESIIVERLGNTLETTEAKQEFRRQFFQIKQMVQCGSSLADGRSS